MAIPVGKFVPSCIVVAATSYCAWPYFSESDRAAGTQKNDNLPKISAEAISPKISPPPQRDPFEASGEKPAKQANNTPPSQGRNPKQTSAAGAANAAISISGQQPKTPPANSTGNAAAKTSQNVSNASKETPALSLYATSIYGNQRLTMINNRIYQEGETLQPVNPADPPCMIAKVLADRVILESQGKTIELLYSDKPNAGAQSKATSAQKPAVESSRTNKSTSTSKPKPPQNTVSTSKSKPKQP
jgi:hypothetical protein